MMEPPPARRIAGTAYFPGRRRPHFGFHEARRRGPSRHRRGSDRDGGGHALHGLTRLDYRAPDNGRGPRRILLECADPTGRARGIGTASTFNGTPPTGSTGYAARAPRLVRNGSTAAVPSTTEHSRSISTLNCLQTAVPSGRRKSRDTVAWASSSIAPAISTPVGPAPTGDNCGGRSR